MNLVEALERMGTSIARAAKALERAGEDVAAALVALHDRSARNPWTDPGWHPEYAGERRERLKGAYDRVARASAGLVLGGAAAEAAGEYLCDARSSGLPAPSPRRGTRKHGLYRPVEGTCASCGQQRNAMLQGGRWHKGPLGKCWRCYRRDRARARGKEGGGT